MKDNTASVASRTMLEKLNNLTNQLEGLERDAFQTEMQNFYLLFTRYLAERVRGKPLDWNKIKSPNPEQIHSFSVLKSCPHDEQKFLLDKLAVLKLNGGLGTTMGCVGPKSAIEVREGLSFLDLTIQQIESRNSMYNTHIPLILMNSFNTDEETKSIIKKYESKEFHIRTFNQSRFPRITKDSLLPLAKNPVSQDSAWYPPGHGDVFLSLAGSGGKGVHFHIQY
jgi:UTP--glucose-1-phosphate uridylyltransferase